MARKEMSRVTSGLGRDRQPGIVYHNPAAYPEIKRRKGAGEVGGTGLLYRAAAMIFAHMIDFGASHISCKVRLADLVRFPGDALRARNTINQKHVDFVVCDRASMCPFRVIELDDATHARRDRRARDAMVDVYLAEAGIAIAHVPAARRYRPAALTEPPGRRGRVAQRRRGA